MMEKYIDEYLIEHNILKASNLTSLSEEEKVKVADNVVSKLYSSIKKKALSANFSEIDSSRGDITKLKNYSDVTNAIKYLKKIAAKGTEGNDLKQAITILDGAMNMLHKHKSAFQKAYSSKNNIVKYLYESSTIAVIQVTSHAVSEAVEFVNAGTFMQCKPVKTKNLLNNNSLKSLEKLVEMDRTNKLDKALKDMSVMHESIMIVKQAENDIILQSLEEEKLSSMAGRIMDTLDDKAGDIVGKVGKIANSGAVKSIGKALIGIGTIIALLQCIRPMISIFIASRIKLSQYLDQLADFVELNSANVTDNDVKQKQEKWIERLRKMSQKIAIDQSVASDRAEAEMKDEDMNTANDINTADDLGIL